MALLKFNMKVVFLLKSKLKLQKKFIELTTGLENGDVVIRTKSLIRRVERIDESRRRP
jgi:hypothetical protein